MEDGGGDEFDGRAPPLGISPGNGDDILEFGNVTLLSQILITSPD